MRYIGKRIPRVDALAKVCGSAIYGADFPLADACFLKVLRSPFPHAHIRKIDESAAISMAGVITVLTWRDVPGEPLYGKIKKDQPLLAKEKVRYVGDPIAAVVARTEEVAEKAAEAIQVDYEPLPAVFSPEAALRADAPLIHVESNLLKAVHLSLGDIQEGLARSDVVVEKTYTTPFVEHAYLEPEAGAAQVDEKGCVWVYAPTQHSHYVAREVCRLLALPPEKVRVVQTEMGGGFGGKMDISVHGLLALAAYKTKKPVKWTYTREESFLTTTKRHPAIMHYRSGARRDGKLMFVEADIFMDTGAYASVGGAVVSRAAIHAVGPYEVPNIRVRCRGVYTNHPIAGAMRGFGVTQVTFAHESQMDLLAEKLGMDPYRFREINVLKINSVTVTGQVLQESVGIGKTLQMAQREYLKTSGRRKPPGKPYLKRGVGYACAFHGVGNTGVVNQAAVKMSLLRNGRILVQVGSAEIGQGLLTVFQQIGAEALGVPVEKVGVETKDTFLTTDADTTGASKQTYMTGNAICEAAKDFIKEISLRLANQYQTLPENIRFAGGKFQIIKDRQKRRISLTDVAAALPVSIGVIGNYASTAVPLDPETGRGIPYPTYSFATQIAEVEVDIRTGKIRVIQIISANDVGKAINPQTIEGQIEGGALMGLGYALMEEYVPSQTKNFKEYLIPTSGDAPRIIPLIVEEAESSGPFGAKGLGELTVHPTAAAIANAVGHALSVRFYQLPLTPDRVYGALKKGEE